MEFRYFWLLILSIFNFTSTTATGNNFQRRCSRLKETFKAPDTNVILSNYIEKNTNLTIPNTHPTCSPSSIIVLEDICRLQLNVTTSRSSSVRMEVWLPVTWEQNGKRFLMTGNGGIGGCTNYYDLAYTSSLGFAAIGHNNGHDGDTGLPFLNNGQVVQDFAYRALLIATKIGKQATNFFYQQQLRKAYFFGCSTGGRQGLKAAQEFPTEYDGIVAGNPASDSAHLVANGGRYSLIAGLPGSPTHLTSEQWDAVTVAVLEQCDDLDGVVDGVLEDPRECVFRPESMLCAANQTWATHECLTATQVSTVRQIYEPFYGNNGRFLYSRMLPGGEAVGFFAAYNGVVNTYSEDWFRYAIYNDSNWTFRENFTLDSVDYADKLDPYGASTFNPNLTGLKASGGKLLVFHGLSDGLITAENSYRYYDNVVRNMSLPSAQLDEFFRYFPISGLDHCAFGQGAWFIGGPLQGALPGATAIPPDNGVLMKMVKWVEAGEAPETVTGLKVGLTGIVGAKEHCKYPKKAKYKGGNANETESWECR